MLTVITDDGSFLVELTGPATIDLIRKEAGDRKVQFVSSQQYSTKLRLRTILLVELGVPIVVRTTTACVFYPVSVMERRSKGIVCVS